MNAEVDQDIINALGQSQQCGSTWAGLGWAGLGPSVWETPDTTTTV